MKKVLIIITALFMTMTSCTKEYSREISKSEKFHLVYMNTMGSTSTANGETSFSVRPIASNLPEQQYIAEFSCTLYEEEIMLSRFYCVETGGFEKMKENMLHDLYVMEGSNPGTDIYGNGYIWPPLGRDSYQHGNNYVFKENGVSIMICPSVREYIDCLGNLR